MLEGLEPREACRYVGLSLFSGFAPAPVIHPPSPPNYPLLGHFRINHKNYDRGHWMFGEILCLITQLTFLRAIIALEMCVVVALFPRNL